MARLPRFQAVSRAVRATGRQRGSAATASGPGRAPEECGARRGADARGRHARKRRAGAPRARPAAALQPGLRALPPPVRPVRGPPRTAPRPAARATG